MAEAVHCKVRDWVAHLCGLLLLFCLTACGSVPVAQDLSQKQANEIVAVLNQRGISAQAEKETGGAARYRVEVRRSFYSEAIALLHERNLPSEEQLSFNALIAPRGIIPGSRENEALRLDRAMGAEIEEALQELPAVHSARVIVRRRTLYSGREDGEAQAAVAVVLVERAGMEADGQEAKQIVLRAIPGISSDRVSVFKHQKNSDSGLLKVNEGLLNRGSEVVRVPLTQFLWVWHVPEDEYNLIALALCSGMLLTLLSGGVLGFIYSAMRGGRPFEAPLSSLKAASLNIKKSKRVEAKADD